jgi:hypothetical protein
LKGKSGPEARASLSLRLLCRHRASAGDHSITGERWPPSHGTELAAGQIVVPFQIILDNPATQFLLRHAFRSGLLKLKQIPMVPGNLYLFWGYRTVHANEACDPDKIRATAPVSLWRSPCR